jgi:phosphate transport system protein
MLTIDKELENLNQMLLKMANIVQKNILDAFSAYQSGDQSVFINDDVVDQYERLIEEVCLDIILKERLYARDLRKVTGILRMVSDLERIGDHAEDIIEYQHNTPTDGVTDINGFSDILETASSMVVDSILSFVNEDMVLAQDVIDRDNIVDDGYQALLKELINKIDNQEIQSSVAIYASIVLKYIERIADHSVNIAEWAVYIVNGYYKDRKIF